MNFSLRYLSDAECFAHTTWSTQEQSELRQRKQPGIKFCLSVYPHSLLKTCAGILGPQSNAISSKSRSNITIPAKHQADTKRLPLCPHNVFRHSKVMVYALVLPLRWRNV